jgi:hypothetical protein
MFFDNKAPQETPSGWYSVTTAKGISAGLGFFCNKCKFGIVANAPPRIFHCGQFEEQPAPGWFKPLPKYTLPYGARRGQRAIISVND